MCTVIRGSAVVLLALLAPALTAVACHEARGVTQQGPVYDLVILRGRVMDPASGLDAVRAVGITGGKIRTVSQHSLQGRETLDARGLVVAPGFIDLHQHAQDAAAYRVEVLDGTTTALELEEGTADVDTWYADRAGKALINYGVSVGHALVRMRVMGDTGRDAPVGPAASRAATDAELAAIITQMDEGLRQGAVAAGVLIEYTPAARPWEIFAMFRVAASHRASVHVHLRNLDEPLYFLETEEIIGAAAASGAAAHVVHIQSSGGEDTPRMQSSFSTRHVSSTGRHTASQPCHRWAFATFWSMASLSFGTALCRRACFPGGQFERHKMSRRRTRACC